jgi:hypothetical protein
VAKNDKKKIALVGADHKNDTKHKKVPKKKYKGHCSPCGKVGHSEDFCWDDPKNARKRPKIWKVCDTRTSGDVAEVALAGFEMMLERRRDKEADEIVLTVFSKPNKLFYYCPVVSEDNICEDEVFIINDTAIPVCMLLCGTQFFENLTLVPFMTSVRQLQLITQQRTLLVRRRKMSTMTNLPFVMRKAAWFHLLDLIFSAIVTATVQKVTKQLFLGQDGSNVSATFCNCDRRVKIHMFHMGL